LERHAPARFEAIQQQYAAQIAAVDGLLAALSSVGAWQSATAHASWRAKQQFRPTHLAFQSEAMPVLRIHGLPNVRHM